MSVEQLATLSVENLYDDYRERIERYLVHLVGPEDAEDLTQDVFLRVARALPEMGSDLHIGPWLYRIARNLAYDALRRRRLIAWLPLEALSVEPPSADHHDPQLRYNGPSEPMRAVFEHLSPPYRRILLLFLQGRSHTEIALSEQTSVSAVKMRLGRAREQFRRLYHAQEVAA